MSHNAYEDLEFSDLDERVSLIEQERLVDKLIQANENRPSAFPNLIERAYTQHNFQSNRLAFRLTLSLWAMIALVFVLANQLMPNFALPSSVHVGFSRFLPLWLGIGVVLFFARLDSFQVGKQLHLHLLLLANALVYTSLSNDLGLGLSGVMCVFIMMLNQSMLLLVVQASRTFGLIACLATLLVFNLFYISVMVDSWVNAWPQFALSNLIILLMSLNTVWVNAFQELQSRLGFLKEFRKRVSDQVRSGTHGKVAQLFPMNQQSPGSSKKLVSIDPHTGVANIKSFQRYLGEAWNAAYHARQSLALILVDLGKLPFDSDASQQAQHLDWLSREEMKRFARRDGDLIGRYDEKSYGILLVNTDLENARKLAEKLIQLLQQLYAPHRAQFKPSSDQQQSTCGINIGVASALPMPGVTAKDLAQRAEQALLGALDKKKIHESG